MNKYGMMAAVSIISAFLIGFFAVVTSAATICSSCASGGGGSPVSITLNQSAIDIGQGITATATCSSGDPCVIISTYKGVASNICIGDGSCTVAFIPSALGNYTLYAEDSADYATSTAKTLQVVRGPHHLTITEFLNFEGYTYLAPGWLGGLSPYTLQWRSGTSTNCTSDTTLYPAIITNTTDALINPSIVLSVPTSQLNSHYFCFSVVDKYGLSNMSSTFGG